MISQYLLWLWLLLAAVFYAYASELPTVVVAVGAKADELAVSSTVHRLRERYERQLQVKILCTRQDPGVSCIGIGDILNIPPDNVINTPESEATADAGLLMTTWLSSIMQLFRTMHPPPAAILVTGDSTAAMATAMAAFYCRVPVVHLQAGLRTWDTYTPHPEEFNRRTISLLATLSLAPTERAKQNLIKDGVDIGSIAVTGSTLVDAFKAGAAKPLSEDDRVFLEELVPTTAIITAKKRNHIVGFVRSGIEIVLAAMNQLSAKYEEFVFYIVCGESSSCTDDIAPQDLAGNKNIVFISRMEHHQFAHLMRSSSLIISDDDAMQEAAALFAVPFRLLSDTTERPESSEAGISQLTGMDVSAVVDAAGGQLNTVRARSVNPILEKYRMLYGDGYAGFRCACRIAKHIGIDIRMTEPTGCEAEYRYEEGRPRLARNIRRDGGEIEASAVRQMTQFPLSSHPSRLFRPYFESERISIILTQYKRNNTEIQLRALFAQTVFSKIEKIVIFQNENYVDLGFLESIDFTGEIIEEENESNKEALAINRKKNRHRIHDIIEIVQSKHRNYKFHGRFALALLFDTEYTVVFDDDTIPQPRWLEISTSISSQKNAIVGPVGVIVGRDRQFYLNPPLDFAIEVDYTGHSWTFKTEWLKYLWGSYSPSWEAGEDIGFSALAWLHGRIRTIMPKMSLSEYEVWGDSVTRFHLDENASHTKEIHSSIRWPLTRYWISNGWTPCLLRDLYEICSGDVKCKNLYQYFKNESNITSDSSMAQPGSRSGHSNSLSKYVSVGTSAAVMWFEASERPSTIEQEDDLKRASSFAPYHWPKAAVLPRHDEDPHSPLPARGDPPFAPNTKNSKRRRRDRSVGEDRADTAQTRHGKKSKKRSKRSRSKGGEL